MTSSGTADFWRLYHELRPEIKSAARAAHRKFLQNPAHPGLNLERVRFSSRGWPVRVTRDFRAVARRFENDDWLWVWIESHEDFERKFQPR